jgi:hypothetical protein
MCFILLATETICCSLIDLTGAHWLSTTLRSNGHPSIMTTATHTSNPKTVNQYFFAKINGYAGRVDRHKDTY